MYQIIKNGEVVELQEKLSWVKHQAKNDILISCSEEDGQGILCGSNVVDEEGNSAWQANSVIYSVVGKPQCKDFEYVEVNEIKWYPISTQQSSDIKDLNEAISAITFGG